MIGNELLKQSKLVWTNADITYTLGSVLIGWKNIDIVGQFGKHPNDKVKNNSLNP